MPLHQDNKEGTTYRCTDCGDLTARDFHYCDAFGDGSPPAKALPVSAAEQEAIWALNKPKLGPR